LPFGHFLIVSNLLPTCRRCPPLEVELAPIQVGQGVTVLWQGKTMFIDHGTPGAIGQAEADGKSATLLDPAKDEFV
jgi:hypothetical protein